MTPLRLLTLALALLLALPASAARLALVIGNAAYAEGPLKNPVNDAQAIAAKLRALGFAVTRVDNLKRDQIGATLTGFASRVRPGDEVVVFYAGHGVQVKGVNYLPAVDAQIRSEADVPLNSLNLNALLDQLDEAKAGVKILLLDACRNNPYARSFRSGSRGLARVHDAPSGTLMHFATRPGSVAADGSGANGLYTSELVKWIDQPGIPVEQLFKRVAAGVRQASSGEQEPWVEGSLQGDFYFRPGPGGPGGTGANVLPEREDGGLKTVLLQTGSFQMGSPGVESGRSDDEGPVHTVRIGYSLQVGKTHVTRGEFAAFVSATGYRTEAETGDGCYKWTGSTWEKDSQANWRNPGFEQGNDHPVVCVSWNDAQEYIGWLNERSPVKGWRLLSEAEWEYAARAGSSTRYFWGEDSDKRRQCQYANGADQTAKRMVPGSANWTVANCEDGHAYTSPVGRFKPNAWGLYDMAGNAWQWTQDCYATSYDRAPSTGESFDPTGCSLRVLRGGSWYGIPQRVRSASRNWREPDFRNDYTGFRLARTVN